MYNTNTVGKAILKKEVVWMCTAVSCILGKHYFGRNLDLECSFGEGIVITPRGYTFHYRKVQSPLNSYAIIGMGIVKDNFPLYFDAVNEYGICMAGLNFPGNAFYHPKQDDKDNIAPFEVIPWILSQCKSLEEVRKLTENLNLVDLNFSEELPNSPLHFMVSDKTGSLVIESVKEGLYIYENEVGVLANNPPFPFHLYNLNNYMHLSNKMPENSFSPSLDLKSDSRGTGTIGLPGDLSSASRFIRAAFFKCNSVLEKNDEKSAVSQFFHILNTVYQPRGCNQLENGSYEYTRYSSCCSAEEGIYYYTTYDNSTITKIDLFEENLNSSELIYYSQKDSLRNNIP